LFVDRLIITFFCFLAAFGNNLETRLEQLRWTSARNTNILKILTHTHTHSHPPAPLSSHHHQQQRRLLLRHLHLTSTIFVCPPRDQEHRSPRYRQRTLNTGRPLSRTTDLLRATREISRGTTPTASSSLLLVCGPRQLETHQPLQGYLISGLIWL
jgi:hypothetical protein